MRTPRILGLVALVLLDLGRVACTSGITYEGTTGKELGMALGGLGTSTLEIGRDGVFQNLRLQNDWSWASSVGPANQGKDAQDGTSGTARTLNLRDPNPPTSVPIGRKRDEDIGYAVCRDAGGVWSDADG